MADTAVTTPPVNPVSDAFAAAAHAAVASARSPLEVAAERDAAARTAQQPSTTQPRLDPNRPAVQHDDTPALDAGGLEKARQADVAKARGDQPAPAKKADDAPAEPEADPSVSSEPWKQHTKKKVSVRGTANDWDALKAKHAEEVAALRKEYEGKAAVGDVTKHPEFAKLKQQHDEYLDALKQVAVERDPEFKARYEPRREAVLGKIKQVSGGASAKIEAILKLPPGEFRDSALEQALETFQPTTKATLMGHLQVLAMVDAERDADLAGRKALYETNQQQFATQQQQAARERESKLTAALDKQIAAWGDSEEGHPLLQKRDGDDKWNRQVEKRVALARSIFAGETDAATLAQASLKAAAHDAALQMAFEATQEVQRLTEQLAKFHGLQPGDGGLAAAIMQSGRNDATVPQTADPFNPAYVQHFGAGLEEARRADYARGGG